MCPSSASPVPGFISSTRKPENSSARTDAANPALAYPWKLSQNAAKELGVEIEPVEVRSPKDIEAAFAIMVDRQPDALIVLQDALT